MDARASKRVHTHARPGLCGEPKAACQVGDHQGAIGSFISAPLLKAAGWHSGGGKQIVQSARCTRNSLRVACRAAGIP